MSQLSQADAAIIKASGLGIEKMTDEEIAAMFDDDFDDSFESNVKAKSIKGKERQSSPDWEMEDESTTHRPSTSRNASSSRSFGTVDDIDVDVDMALDDEFIQLTQMNPRVASKRNKVTMLNWSICSYSNLPCC